jgi:hypothetical protein
MRFSKIENNFIVAEFEDKNGSTCVVSDSSVVNEACIRLSVAAAAQGEAGLKMHLNQQMAADLIPVLQYFVDHGEMPFTK